MSPTLRALLDRLPPADRLDYPTLAAAIYDARYTGPLVIHWLNGRPQQVDLGLKGSPIRLSIVESLDSRGSSQAG